MRAIFSNPVYRFIWTREMNFQEKKFRQNLLGGSTFPTLVNAKNQHQNSNKDAP